MGNDNNVGIHQRVFGDQVPNRPVRCDHRDDVRGVFAWAFDEVGSETPVGRSRPRMAVDLRGAQRHRREPPRRTTPTWRSASAVFATRPKRPAEPITGRTYAACSVGRLVSQTLCQRALPFNRVALTALPQFQAGTYIPARFEPTERVDVCVGRRPLWPAERLRTTKNSSRSVAAPITYAHSGVDGSAACWGGRPATERDRSSATHNP